MAPHKIPNSQLPLMAPNPQQWTKVAKLNGITGAS